MSDDRVQQVIDELDPTPAHEAAWPVSRRQTLRALAGAGLVGAGSGSASAESAGTVIADEAVFSNYGSESVSDGWELTIDDDVFALTESDTETIGLPDGGVGEELVLPNGAEAIEVIAPDGTVVFDSPDIPDSAIHQWPFDEGSGESVADSIGDIQGSVNGPTFISDGWEGGSALDFDGGGTDDVTFDSLVDETGVDSTFSVAITTDLNNTNDQFIWTHRRSGSDRWVLQVVNNSLQFVGWDGSRFGVAINTVPTSRTRIGVAFDGPAQTAEIYFNGESQSSDETGIEAGSLPQIDGIHNLGRRIDADDNAQDGVSDNPIVYSDLLTGSEFVNDYESQPWA